MKKKGIFNSVEEFINHYGAEKFYKIITMDGAPMLFDSSFCDYCRKSDNNYTTEEEAEFISDVGEEIANKIKREQPENYPIIVSHWYPSPIFFPVSDVIRINEKNEEDDDDDDDEETEGTYRQNTPYKDIK